MNVTVTSPLRRGGNRNDAQRAPSRAPDSQCLLCECAHRSRRRAGFAKAFLLRLVADGALPWISEVQRSMARHQCKHLLAIVMDWLGPFDVEELMAQSKRDTQRHEQKMA